MGRIRLGEEDSVSRPAREKPSKNPHGTLELVDSGLYRERCDEHLRYIDRAYPRDDKGGGKRNGRERGGESTEAARERSLACLPRGAKAYLRAPEGSYVAPEVRASFTSGSAAEGAGEEEPVGGYLMLAVQEAPPERSPTGNSDLRLPPMQTGSSFGLRGHVPSRTQVRRLVLRGAPR